MSNPKEFDEIIHCERIGDSLLYNHYVVGELVRCKNCAYYEPEVDDPHKSNCQRLWGGMCECKADSYCSDGVRKNQVEE